MMKTLCKECVNLLKPVWERIDDLVLRNQRKVLLAFKEERINPSHFMPSTGYGYGDEGRDALDALFARVFGGEEALVRLAWTSGTHVLKTALFALLRPGDELLSVTGMPYETLRPVIGPGPGSLAGHGVSFRSSSHLLDLEKGDISESELQAALKSTITRSTRVIFIQRSRGYSLRPCVSLESLRTFMRILRNFPEVLTLVDNCYCEFADTEEPPSLGVTLAAGSLIKNPGGGVAPTGGYVVGKGQFVNRVSETLYAPGIAGEVGSNPYGYRDVYQGLFLAPKVVGESLKGATFASLFFEKLGFPTDPGPFDRRSDIVQCIVTGAPEKLKVLAAAIQSMSPVDSYATPEPWDMPGYKDRVIMAAGAFVQGSSIELSCDGPFVPPYVGYLQGGLTVEHVMLACTYAGEKLKELSSPDVSVKPHDFA